MRTRSFLAAAALLLALAPRASAQDDPWDYDHGPRERVPTGGFFGLSLVGAVPQGEFGDYIDGGFGGQFSYVQRLGGSGPFAVRAEGGMLVYGYERQRVLLSSTIGGRILADLTTSNNIGYLGVGPQIGVPAGTLQPYVNGFVGLSYIYTSSSVSGSGSGEAFATTTNYDDLAFAYGAGAGMYVPIGGRRGPAPVSLDVGVTYRAAGQAEYLVKGAIRDNPDGSITLFPVRSETDLLAFHLGFTVGTTRRR